VSRAGRILILLHEREPDPGVVPYRIWFLREIWEACGVEVVVQKGIGSTPQADVVIPHLDLTVVPPEYVRFLERYPVVLNRRVTDVSKRVISQHLVRPGEDYEGPVIVKTDRNYGGLPERRIAPGRRVRRWSGKIRTLAKACAMLPEHYPVFESMRDVPPKVFDNDALVVERFLPEREGAQYCLRTWVFLGSRELSMRRCCPVPVIKPSWSTPPEEVEVPEAMRSARTRLGLDYGKLDFVVRDGEAILFDATRTPGLRAGPLDKLQRRAHEDFADGIEEWLPALRSGTDRPH